MTRVKLYAYDKCGTCRKARAWLERRGVELEVLPIVDAPPSAEALAEIRAAAGVPVKKLFNTSGQAYRQGGWKEKITALSEPELLAALAADGKLIKRPLVVGDGFALVGFDEAAYAARF